MFLLYSFSRRRQKALWPYNRTMQETTFEREKKLFGEGFLPVGIDEAGRGPLAGPVVATAVLFKDESFTIPREMEKDFHFIRDSKKLSPQKREVMFKVIQEHFHIGVGIVSAETIDRVNILQATFLAMKGALSDLLKKIPETKGKKKYILLDGNQLIPHLSEKQEAIINGDGLVKSIAAASIMAKVTRDRIIVEMDSLYPGYGLAQHKGYGTKEHMKALRHLGPSPIHRMSFEPVYLSIPENMNRKISRMGIGKKPRLATTPIENRVKSA